MRGTGRRSIGDVASATAGFRDEFYALSRAARSRGEIGWSRGTAPLVTVGMIDVARLDRSVPRRLGGREVVDPRLDRRALRRDATRVAAWATARSVPKVLVATQTRVVEAVADPSGRCVPVTPVVSVEPAVGSDVDVWALLAALCAPAVAATMARQGAGTGLSTGSFRVSAASVRAVPLPADPEAWAAGSALVRDLQVRPSSRRRDRLRAFGSTMDAAYGIAGDGRVLEWWLALADRV